MVNQEIKYDLRILSCFNLLFEIKNMMYTEKKFKENSQEILDDFEKKFYSHLKLICYKSFSEDNDRYLSSTNLIQRIYDINQNLEEQRDNLIPFIRDSLTTMEKNLMTLYKLVPINLVNNNNNILKSGSGRKKKINDEKREHINAADEKLENQNFEVISKEINFENNENVIGLNLDEDEEFESQNNNNNKFSNDNTKNNKIEEKQIELDFKSEFIDNKAKSLEKIKQKIEETYRNPKPNNKDLVNPDESLDTIEEVNSLELSSSRISRNFGNSFILKNDGLSPTSQTHRGSAITAMESFKPLKTEKTPVRVTSKRNPLNKNFKTRRVINSISTVKLIFLFC